MLVPEHVLGMLQAKQIRCLLCDINILKGWLTSNLWFFCETYRHYIKIKKSMTLSHMDVIRSKILGKIKSTLVKAFPFLDY